MTKAVAKAGSTPESLKIVSSGESMTAPSGSARDQVATKAHDTRCLKWSALTAELKEICMMLWRSDLAWKD